MGVSGGPIIVRGSSLVLELDAADRNSYTSGSNTWFDLTANSINGTVLNGHSYGSANGGSLNFNGTNQTVNFGSGSSTLLSSFTISTTFTYNSTVSSSTYIILGRMGAQPIGYAHNYYLGISNGKFTFGFKQAGAAIFPALYTNQSPVTGQVYNITISYSTASSVAFYINGQIQTAFSSSNMTTQSIDTNLSSIFSIAANYAETAYYTSASVYNAQIYNRVLSAQEIQQNYNQLKSRFNL